MSHVLVMDRLGMQFDLLFPKWLICKPCSLRALCLTPRRLSDVRSIRLLSLCLALKFLLSNTGGFSHHRAELWCGLLPERRLNSYLSRRSGLVVVIVGGQDDVFVDAIQQPQEEFQCVVLGVTTKLRSILGHYSLQERKTDRNVRVFHDSFGILGVFIVGYILKTTNSTI